MPWHAVPAPSSAIDSADAFASEPGGLPWVILTVPLPVSRPRTPSAVSCSLVETMSTASALGIAGPSGWVVEDRHGVRRARVLDPHGVLRVGGVGLVHHQQPAERVGSTVGVEHAPAPLDALLSRFRPPPVTAECGTLPEQTQPQGGRAGRRYDLDRVVEARDRARGRGRRGRAAPSVPAATPARASIERRVSSARDASLQRSSSCARIGSVLTAAPGGGRTPQWEIEPCERTRRAVECRLESALRGHSSAGRASGLHPGGRGFESRWLHCHGGDEAGRSSRRRFAYRASWPFRAGDSRQVQHPIFRLRARSPEHRSNDPTSTCPRSRSSRSALDVTLHRPDRAAVGNCSTAHVHPHRLGARASRPATRPVGGPAGAGDRPKSTGSRSTSTGRDLGLVVETDGLRSPSSASRRVIACATRSCGSRSHDAEVHPRQVKFDRSSDRDPVGGRAETAIRFLMSLEICGRLSREGP